MPTPIKTLLLQAIKTALTGMTGVGDVIRNPAKPPDMDVAHFPAIHVWDEEETMEERNRIARPTFPLQIDVWIQEKEETASDTADVWQAEILKTLLNDPDIRFYSLSIRPEKGAWAGKSLIDEFMFGIALRFEVTYAYVWGDPYTLAKNP